MRTKISGFTVLSDCRVSGQRLAIMHAQLKDQVTVQRSECVTTLYLDICSIQPGLDSKQGQVTGYTIEKDYLRSRREN